MQLTGGGFLVALAQVTAVYYALAALLHFAVPRLFPVRRVQKGEAKPGQARTEALNCVGGQRVGSAGHGGPMRVASPRQPLHSRSIHPVRFHIYHGYNWTSERAGCTAAELHSSTHPYPLQAPSSSKP